MWWPFKKKEDPVTECIVKTILNDLRFYSYTEWKVDNNRCYDTYLHPKLSYKLRADTYRHGDKTVYIEGMHVSPFSALDQYKILSALKEIRKKKQMIEVVKKSVEDVEKLKTIFPKCFGKKPPE